MTGGTPVPPAYRIPRSRRAFTLLELVLATSIGALILVAASGLFITLDKSERVFATRARQSAEHERAQPVLRRGLMRLLMTQGAATDKGLENGTIDAVPTDRPRIVLEPDPAGPPGSQRLEVVFSQWPVPSSLMAPSVGWAFEPEDDTSLDFATGDGSGGAARAVFEIRPDHTRQQALRTVGVVNPMSEKTDALGKPGYSLWVRRMPAAELAGLQNGQPHHADGTGDREPEARRLASSYRLASGLTKIRWRIFRWEQWIDTYHGWTNADIPSYIELEFETVTGDYVSWLFEVGFSVGTDPTTQAANDLLNTDPDNPNGNGDGNNNDDNDDGSDPGNTIPNFVPGPNQRGST